MTERVRVVILCEDRQQEVFARAFLGKCGIAPLRVLINPSGKGAGEQYVREQYPKEGRTFRGKFSSQPNTCLVVLTDADVLEVTQRLDKLEAELRKNDLPVRRAEERIGMFIPKRNIETWIHFLMGEPVNEQTEYPKFAQERSC